MLRVAATVLALGAVLLRPATAQATVYDAAGQFSLAGNPNGAWTYGYGTGGSSFIQMGPASTSTTCGGSTGLLCFTNGLPAIGKNVTAANLTVAGTATIPNSVLWLHPGDADNLDAILRFVAPFAGTYNLAATFSRLDFTGNGNGVVAAVYDNLAPLDSSVLAVGSYGTSVAFSNVVTLAAGDFLDFVVNRNGTYDYDSTGLSLTITSDTVSVPEPVGMAVLCVGLLGTCFAKRRLQG
jgi:hypothetical protein